MLRTTLRIAVLLALVVICAWVVDSSETFQSCVQHNQTTSTENNPKENATVLPIAIYEKCTGSFIDANHDGIVAAFTFVLALSTIWLWLSTKDAAIAAGRAAAIAERALTELERPYLFILDYNWLLVEKAQADESGLVYSVANGGKLPAFIKTVKFGMRFGDSIPAMEDEPAVHDLLTAPLIGGGERRQIIQGIADEGDGDPARECEIRGGMARIPTRAFQAKRVIAKISIEYDGPITAGHTTTACWEWHPVKYAFTQYGGPG